MRASVLVAIAMGSVALSNASARAQVIRGSVIDATTKRGIADVDVTLSDSARARERRISTDSAGNFRFVLEGSGAYTLRAQRLGYTTTSAEGVQVDRTEEIELQLKMGVEAIPIDPLIIIARRPERLGRLAEFYDRVEMMGKLGTGRFITRAEIESRNPHLTTDLLRMVPGLRVSAQSRSVVVTRQGGGCVPAIFVDGMFVNRDGRTSINDFVMPQMIEGVEIYRGPSEVPPQFQDRSGCGAIVIWTRRGTTSGKPWSWWRAAVGGGLVLLVVLIAR